MLWKFVSFIANIIAAENVKLTALLLTDTKKGDSFNNNKNRINKQINKNGSLSYYQVTTKHTLLRPEHRVSLMVKLETPSEDNRSSCPCVTLQKIH